MNPKGQLLQDPFLNILRKEHVPVSIYLVNGIKLQGQIESFDQYVVLLRNTVTQMVYKHAISTIVPGRPVIGVVMALLFGGLIGFAPYNKPVAKLFLGDVGSLPIGLLAGYGKWA